jgi:endoglucanase
VGNRGWIRVLGLGLALAFAAPPAVARASLGGLRVDGNKLLAGSRAIQLRGVNRSGTEYMCVERHGIFDGPSDAASVKAIASWHVNIVRVPLNEDCWLGVNGVPAKYSGASYRSAILAYVKLLHHYGMYAELSLMWAGPGRNLAIHQPPAPDADHSPAMWTSMARTFHGDQGVILAPWGEPTTDWACFMSTGCQATFGSHRISYHTAPMTQAVSRMRAAGYRGPIAIPCINFANACGLQPDGTLYDGSTWLLSRPSDPLGQLIAEAHIYGKNTCETVACFDASLLPVARVVPLMFGETGETYDASSCGSSHITTFLNWADSHGVGYEAWVWDAWGNCSALIRNYRGTPYSAYGRAVQAHLRARSRGH